jgi:hypothetical protein
MGSTPQFLPEPELPFPGASGCGVRVAVIDSGVNPRHSHILGIAGGVSIFGPGHIEENSFLDMLGSRDSRHGRHSGKGA